MTQNIMFHSLIILLGLVGLIKFSDKMIDGAVSIAKRFKISPLVIGATVVAMGTSLAEITVNLVEIYSTGHTSVVLGNILGSNLVNIGLGLGLAAIISKISSHFIVIEKEIPLYFASTALLTSFAGDGVLTRFESLFLMVSFSIILYLIYQYARRDKGSKEEFSHEKHVEHDDMSAKKSMFLLIGGLIGLILSAKFLVSSATVVAESLGIDKYIIGLTIVGIGTSFPEIMASIQAARKGYPDIVLGNVFGSNIFNIFFGIGLPMLFKNLEVIPDALNDLYFLNMMGLGMFFLLLIETKLSDKNKTLGRYAGVMIVLVYVGYIGSKIIRLIH